MPATRAPAGIQQKQPQVLLVVFVKLHCLSFTGYLWSGYRFLTAHAQFAYSNRTAKRKGYFPFMGKGSSLHSGSMTGGLRNKMLYLAIVIHCIHHWVHDKPLWSIQLESRQREVFVARNATLATNLICFNTLVQHMQAISAGFPAVSVLFFIFQCHYISITYFTATREEETFGPRTPLKQKDLVCNYEYILYMHASHCFFSS